MLLEKARPVVDQRHLEAVLGEVLVHRVAAAGTFRANDHARAAGIEEAPQRDERIVGATIHLDGRQRRGRRWTGIVGRGRRREGQLDACERLHHAVERIRRKEEIGRRQQWPRLVSAHQLVARLRVLPEVAHGLLDVAMQDDRRVARQVVGEDGRGIEEQRQVILDASRRDAVAHVLVERGLRRIAFERLAIAAAEAVAAALVDRELARRQEAHVRHRVQRALRVDVEGADRLDVVAEQIDAVGQRAAHREEIDQPAAHAELAWRDHLRDVLVTGEGELAAQRIDVEALPLLQEEREPGEIAGGRKAIERGGRRSDHDVAFAARDPVERGEALGDEILVRREMVVRQRLPVGQQRDLETGCEPGDLLDEALRGERIRSEDGDHAGARAQAQSRAARSPAHRPSLTAVRCACARHRAATAGRAKTAPRAWQRSGRDRWLGERQAPDGRWCWRRPSRRRWRPATSIR